MLLLAGVSVWSQAMVLRDRPHRHRAGAQDRPGGRGCGRPGGAGLLQVHRLLPVVGPGRARPLRRRLRLAAAGDHPAGRASRSSRSRRSATWSTSYRGQMRSRCRCSTSRVYLSFFPHLVAGPIVRASRVPAPDRAPARPPHGSTVGRAFILILGGVFKKVVLSDLLSSRDRRPRVRSAQAALRAGDAAGRSTPTPCRSTATSAATPTSPSASPCCSASASRRTSTRPYTAASLQRLLAALAHDALAVAARLPVHPAGRQPQGHRAAPTST